MRRRLLAIAALLACGACRSREEAPLAVLSTLPAFTLVDQTGAAFGREQMHGQVWVANFIFTRCPTICPTFTAQMAALEKKAAAAKQPVRFVSFSVDPAHDTPAVLAAWGKDRGADWTLLTGSVEQIQATVVGGLKIAAKPIGPDDDLASIFHGSHFVLIDEEGRIRGYYDSSDPARVEAILADAARITPPRS